MACALASCDARARAMWSRARCVGNTGLPGVLGVRGGCADLPGVLGVLVAALAMSVLPAGNAAPVVPCGAALAAPGATVGGDVSKCLLNTSSVLAGEQASTAWQVAQVDAALTDIDAVVGTARSAQNLTSSSRPCWLRRPSSMHRPVPWHASTTASSRAPALVLVTSPLAPAPRRLVQPQPAPA